jgi:hypothetical protein
MKPLRQLTREALLPLAVFAGTVAIHYLWTSAPPSPPPAPSPWASLPAEEVTRLSQYLGGGGYWLAYSYGISFAFAAVALRRYLRKKSASGKRFALGGATFSGALAFFGCYLTGCCGSPMLVVYLNLFGAGFLPFAKPFIAGVTTLSLLGAWLWMRRNERRGEACCPSNAGCCGR